MKVAILGSKGFLGSVLSKQLETHQIIEIHRGLCDLTDSNNVQAVLSNGQFDAVINCASIGGKQQLGTTSDYTFHSNLKIFKNLKDNSQLYGVLINIGSGAEFDITTNISMAQEEHISNQFPYDSYGLSKNIISRECLTINNARTLRLFGCFDSSEPPFRVIRRMVDNINAGIPFRLDRDRLFSWISALDFADIVNQTINNWEDLPNDINCAYPNPIKISEALKLWCTLHNIEYNIDIADQLNNEYTCNTDLMQSFFNIKYGFENSLKVYE